MSDFIIFLLGAMLGAVIQRYTDKIVAYVERIFLGKIFRFKSEKVLKVIGESLSIGWLHSNIIIVENDPNGIDRKLLIKNSKLATFDVSKYELIYKNKNETASKKWNEKLNNGSIFNGRKLGLKNYHPTRDEFEKISSLVLEFEPVDYLTQRIRTEIFQSISESEKRELIQNFSSSVHPFFSNSFGVSLMVITFDGKLVITQRGPHVAVNSNKITCSVVEGMDSEKDFTDRKPNPFLTAKRGLSEELGISLDAEDDSVLNITGLILDPDFYEWSMIGYCDFRRAKQRITSEIIQQYWNTAKPIDKSENKRIEFIDMSLNSVGKFISENHENMTNYAVACLVMMLFSLNPRGEVYQTFKNRK